MRAQSEGLTYPAQIDHLGPNVYAGARDVDIDGLASGASKNTNMYRVRATYIDIDVKRSALQALDAPKRSGSGCPRWDWFELGRLSGGLGQ